MNYSLYPNAKAEIKGGDMAPNIRGEVLFYQKKCSVLVSVRIFGLPKNESGFFAFHIHEGEECTGENFADTGGHYNPDDDMHPMHAGDLPPLLSCGGCAYMDVKTNRFRVGDILGRTVIIHSRADDFHTQPSGNAGEKLACGIIKKVYFNLYRQH